MDHFKGKSVVEHLKVARGKGAFALGEIHGAEMPGYLAAAADAARETAVVLLIIWLVFPLKLAALFIFSGAFLIWKAGRSSLLGWNRLDRLHRVIEEERWEIEHNRDQEKEELAALYAAKGLSGKILDEVVTILMADDNRLLQIMLEEEMGLTLEAYEHPLKQSFGAVIGVVVSAFFFILGYFLHSMGPLIGVGISILVAALVVAEKNRIVETVIWNFSIAAFVGSVTFFLKRVISL